MGLDVPPAPFYRGKTFFEGLGLPLRIIHVERSPVFPSHRHDFTELVIVYEGSGIHAYADTRDLSYVNVVFDAEALLDDPLAERVALAPPGWRGSAGSPSSFRLSAFGTREALAHSVEEMAEEARTGPRNFRREFKRVEGMSPKAYRATVKKIPD